MRFDELQPKPKLFLDMDGVLADFFGAWARSHGVSHYKQIDKQDIKGSLDQIGQDAETFFARLPLLPGAIELLRAAQNYGGYTILSSPLERHEEASIRGKRQWIEQHLGAYPPEHMIFERNKARFATTRGVANILIDDYGVNIDAWQTAGGRAFKHRSQRAAESIDWLKGIQREIEAVKPPGAGSSAQRPV